MHKYLFNKKNSRQNLSMKFLHLASSLKDYFLEGGAPLRLAEKNSRLLLILFKKYSELKKLY